MSDHDPSTRLETSVDVPSQQGSKAASLLMMGGTGCTLMLCLGLLISSGVFLVRSRMTGAPAEEDVAVEAGVSIGKPEVQSDEPANAGREFRAVDATNQTVPDNASGPASEPLTPAIGPITFAPDTTAEGAPIGSDFSFEAGLTQLHAVFEYENLTPSDIWKQVWYHNGSEVMSTSQPWLDDETGVYDYVIEAGGAPLPAGQWALEFYIDDELMAAGSFLIEAVDDGPAPATLPDLSDIPKVYKLAYTKWNGEKHDLYVGDTNGASERFIMGRAAGPSWSPDGRYIFFYGEEGVDQQVINGAVHPLPGVSNGIARLNAAPLPANIGQLQLFQGHGWNDGTARWANVSPDGSMIAYDGDRGGGRRIYFLGTNANQQFRFEIIGEQADWSPDSQRIVYRSGRNNQTGIWISSRTDSGHIRITTGGSDSFPTWSFDGKTIAFSRDAGGNVDIYTVNVDGSNLAQLTNTPGHDTLPLFLPNGDIVFRSARAGSWAIWKMAGDGSDQTQIIPNAPVGPEWSFSRMDVLR